MLFRSEILVAAGVTGTSYVDDGQGQNQVAPGHLSSAAAGGGTFPATPALQPLTYVVSSTISGLERVSYATQILLAGVTETSVSLSWDSVPGATYNLYRFNYGTGGYERLASNLTDASKPYVDTNLATTATAPSFGEPPLRPGSLAKWALVEDPANAGQPLQMAVAREGLEATTIALTDGMNAVIYVAGGRSAVADADYLHAVESLKIPYASGLPTAGWKLQGNGTLAGANVVGHPLRHSRAFFALLNSQDHDVIPRAPDPKEPPCVDFDGDGYKPCSCFAQSVTLDAGACAAAGTITTVNSCDCNDTDPTIYPCGPDLCGDGIAQNCVADTMCAPSCATPDVDADGHRALSCGGDDCCDSGSESSLGCSPATAGGVHPGATEICGNGIDENCDGIDPSCTTTCTTDADGDGRIACSCYPNGPPGTTACGAPNCDCNDANAAIYPCAPEIPCDGIAQSCLADSCQILSLQVPISWGVQRRSMASARSTIDPGALMSLPTAIFTPARAPATAAALICAPPVWIVAVQGQSAFNSGQNTIEACVVDSASGDLAQCDLAAAPTVPWTDQTAAAVGPKGLFGLGAQLWDIATLPTVGSWSGATDETLTAGPTITSSSGSFWNVDLTEDGACHFTPPNRTGCTAYGCGVYGNQSADSKFLARAYYRASRVAGYVFVVGGWLSSLGGVIGDLERHLQ